MEPEEKLPGVDKEMGIADALFRAVVEGTSEFFMCLSSQPSALDSW